MLQKQRKTLLIITSFMWAILIYPSFAYPFATSSHKGINEAAAQGLPSLNPYLRDVLGFASGLDTKIKNNRGVDKPVIDWIQKGGAFEDRLYFDNSFGEILGVFRSFNHFHQSMRPWDQTGFKGIWQPSVRWAQNPNQTVGREASWFDGRNSYLTALLASTQQDRDANFAETFRFSIDEDGIWRIRNF